MKNFTDALVDSIIENEKPRLNRIMNEVAKKIQSDVVAVTYNLIDAFYEDYQRSDGRVYIRTDENKHPQGKDGRFKNKNSTQWKRGHDRSLMSAIKAFNTSGEPAIGVCRPLDGAFGYQAGVLFDEGYFNSTMKHSVKGKNFTEWDIAEDFLWGVHGNESVYTTTPSAGWALYEYIDSYKPRFDKHYSDACKKFK